MELEYPLWARLRPDGGQEICDDSGRVLVAIDGSEAALLGEMHDFGSAEETEDIAVPRLVNRGIDEPLAARIGRAVGEIAVGGQKQGHALIMAGPDADWEDHPDAPLMPLSGPVVDRARALLAEGELPVEKKVLDHGEDQEVHLDVLAPYPYNYQSGRRIDDADLGRVVYGAANLVWLALDGEAEGTTDEIISVGLVELAQLLDEAGIKWTSGR